MLRRRQFLPIVAVALFATGASAQVSSRQGPAKVASGELAMSLLSDMKQDLRSLFTAMEVYFMDHATYGRVLGSPGDTTKVQVQPSEGVTLTLVYVTRNTWTARAVHDWLPGRSCVLAVGAIPPSRTIRTTRDRLTSMSDAEVACDSP